MRPSWLGIKAVRLWRIGPIFATVSALFAGLTLTAAQGHFSYSIALSGLNERPLPASPSLATGSADITVDILPTFTIVAWNIRWKNLSGLPINAHLHGPTGPEGTAQPFFGLANFFSDSTPMSGGYAGFRQLNDPNQIAAVRGGLAYLDIHTEAYPDGEIRGNLQPVPEPGAAALVAFLGLVTRLVGRGATAKTAHDSPEE